MATIPRPVPKPKHHYVIREYDDEGFLLRVVEFATEHPVELKYEEEQPDPFDWQPWANRYQWAYSARVLKFKAHPDKITLTTCMCGTAEFRKCLLHETKQRRD